MEGKGWVKSRHLGDREDNFEVLLSGRAPGPPTAGKEAAAVLFSGEIFIGRDIGRVRIILLWWQHHL